MADTMAIIADTAGINGWTAQYSGPRTNNGLDSIAVYTRDGVRVHVRYTMAGAVAEAQRTVNGVHGGYVSHRIDGKRETVIGWLTAAVESVMPRPAVSDTLRIRAAAASVLLSRAIDSLAADTVAATGIAYAPMADAPDTFDALLNEYSVATMARVLPVWDGASDATVYDGADTNYAFRYWHDMGHVLFDCDFTPAGETALQLSHHMPIVFRALGVQCICSDPVPLCAVSETALLAARLYYADTVGQIEYNVRHGEFPTDQREFCLAYVVDPTAAVDATF